MVNEGSIQNTSISLCIAYFSLFYNPCFIVLYFEVQYDSDSSYCHYGYFLIKCISYKDLKIYIYIFHFSILCIAVMRIRFVFLNLFI